MRTRAIASRYYEAGADGMYVFNWQANRVLGGHCSRVLAQPTPWSVQTRFAPQPIASCSQRANGVVLTAMIVFWVTFRVALKRTLTSTGPKIVLNVSVTLKAEDSVSPLLRLRLDQWGKGRYGKSLMG